MLCLLREEAGEVQVIFEVRSPHLTHQPGEICFPGGGMEPGEQPLDCALRETEEELGIPSAAVRVIAPLDPIVHSSGQLVYPFLATVDAALPLSIQKTEVASVFTVPLDWFRTHPPKVEPYTMAADLSCSPPELMPFLPHYRRQRSTVIWCWEDRVIWGMTAKILRRLLELLAP